MAQRATLDLSDLQPGVGERRTLSLPGVALGEGDEVFVELEANLPLEEIRSLPEWSAVAPAGSS